MAVHIPTSQSAKCLPLPAYTHALRTRNMLAANCTILPTPAQMVPVICTYMYTALVGHIRLWWAVRRCLLCYGLSASAAASLHAASLRATSLCATYTQLIMNTNAAHHAHFVRTQLVVFTSWAYTQLTWWRLHAIPSLFDFLALSWTTPRSRTTAEKLAQEACARLKKKYISQISEPLFRSEEGSGGAHKVAPTLYKISHMGTSWWACCMR